MRSLTTEMKDELFNTVWRQSITPLALVGKDGMFLKCNRAWSNLVGYSEEELMSLRFQDITHEDDIPHDEAEAEEVECGAKNSYIMTKRYFHKDGHLIWITLYVNMVPEANGKGMFCFFSQASPLSAQSVKEYLPALKKYTE